MIKGENGTPMVTMSVQMPMYFALSFLKKVSVTTTLPIAAAGEMKKATIALHTAIVAYVGALAHPMFPARLTMRESRKRGRRPYAFEKGFQIKGAPPRIAICSEVRYEAR